MLNKTILIAELQLLPCGTGDKFNAKNLDCKLNEEKLCKRLNLPLPMIFNKLIAEDLMR